MLVKENTGLVVVDIQGKLARLVHNSEAVIANVAKLIQGAKALGLPVVLLEQHPEKLGRTVNELGAELTDIEAISKYTFNACDTPEFVEAIKTAGKQSWLVCGIEAHICVLQTARGLSKLGYRVEVVGDCVSSRQAANIALAQQSLRDQGIAITGLEMCLYELVGDCRAPGFKQVLGLVR